MQTEGAVLRSLTPSLAIPLAQLLASHSLADVVSESVPAAVTNGCKLESMPYRVDPLPECAGAMFARRRNTAANPRPRPTCFTSSRSATRTVETIHDHTRPPPSCPNRSNALQRDRRRVARCRSTRALTPKAALSAWAAFRCAGDTTYLARVRLEKLDRRRLPKYRPSRHRTNGRAAAARELVPARTRDASRAVRRATTGHLSKSHSSVAIRDSARDDNFHHQWHR